MHPRLLAALASAFLATPTLAQEFTVFSKKLWNDSGLVQEYWRFRRDKIEEYDALREKQAPTPEERRELAEAAAEIDKNQARLDAAEPALRRDFAAAMDKAFNLSSCRGLLKTVDPKKVRESGGKFIGSDDGAFGSFVKVSESADHACAVVTKRMAAAYVDVYGPGEKFSDLLRRDGRCDVYNKSFYEWHALARGPLANLMACIEFKVHASPEEARHRPLPNGYVLDGFLVLRNGPSRDSPADRPSLSELFALGPDGKAVYLTNSFDENRLLERLRGGEFDYLK